MANSAFEILARVTSAFILVAAACRNNVHGSGWNAWFGTSASPLFDGEETYGTGSCLSVILAASQVFVHSFSVQQESFAANALNWRTELLFHAPLLGHPVKLGSVWALGIGSVGTAALYFHTLATRNFDSVLIDIDRVKLHNITRSPIFTHRDTRELKVKVTKAFLNGASVHHVL